MRVDSAISTNGGDRLLMVFMSSLAESEALGTSTETSHNALAREGSKTASAADYWITRSRSVI